MPLDIEAMRTAMRRWASGVTIVTASDGVNRQGMTGSSFTSISFQPPQVLVVLHQSTRTHQLVLQSGTFGATILAESQRELSERFARRIPGWDEDRFAGVETETLVSGAPFIKGGLAYFDCRVDTIQPVGENTLFIAEVVAAESFPADNPLVYFDRGYRLMKSEGSE